MTPPAVSAIDYGQTIEARPAMGVTGSQQMSVVRSFAQDGQGVQVFPIFDHTWRTGLLEKLSRYGVLKENWNSYGSPSPSPHSLKRASWFVSSVLSDRAPRPHVVHAASDETRITARHADSRWPPLSLSSPSTSQCHQMSSIRIA